MDIADSFPHKFLPIAVVSSKRDTEIPSALSKRVFDALVESKCSADILYLDKSAHPFYANDDASDARRYAEFLSRYYQSL